MNSMKKAIKEQRHLNQNLKKSLKQAAEKSNIYQVSIKEKMAELNKIVDALAVDGNWCDVGSLADIEHMLQEKIDSFEDFKNEDGSYSF